MPWSMAFLPDGRLLVTERVGRLRIIENGALGPSVAEITIAGNLLDMFRNLRAANDLEHRRAINVPTLRIDGMMVAGA